MPFRRAAANRPCMETVDARGNLHDSRTGQFAGHQLAEADPADILGGPLARKLSDWLTHHFDTDLDPETSALLTEVAGALGVHPHGYTGCPDCGARMRDTRELCDTCTRRDAAAPAVPTHLRDRVDAGVESITRAVCNDPRYLHVGADDALLEAATREVTRRLVCNPNDPMPMIVAQVLQTTHFGQCRCTHDSHDDGEGHRPGLDTVLVAVRGGVLLCGECIGLGHHRWPNGSERWGARVPVPGQWRQGA